MTLIEKTEHTFFITIWWLDENINYTCTLWGHTIKQASNWLYKVHYTETSGDLHIKQASNWLYKVHYAETSGDLNIKQMGDLNIKPMITISYLRIRWTILVSSRWECSGHLLYKHMF